MFNWDVNLLSKGMKDWSKFANWKNTLLKDIKKEENTAADKKLNQELNHWKKIKEELAKRMSVIVYLPPNKISSSQYRVDLLCPFQYMVNIYSEIR